MAWFAESNTRGLDGLDRSYEARLSHAGDVWGGQVGHMLVGDDFNPEVGFVRRKGFRQTVLQGRFSPRPDVARIRQLTFQGDASYVENERSGVLESRDVSGLVLAALESGDELTVTWTKSYEFLASSALISRATIPVGRYSFDDVQVSYLFGPQRAATGLLSVRRGGFYGGAATSIDLTESRIDLVSRLTVEPSLSLNWVDLPALQSRSGEFDQHVTRLRLTYSVTPRMFVSTLAQYNSGTESFAANVRLRWEWSPGSELFVVYGEERNTNPLIDRWSALSSRGLAIKINRLFWF